MSARAVCVRQQQADTVQHSSTLRVGAVDLSGTQHDGLVHKQLSTLPLLVCGALHQQHGTSNGTLTYSMFSRRRSTAAGDFMKLSLVMT